MTAQGRLQSLKECLLRGSALNGSFWRMGPLATVEAAPSSYLFMSAKASRMAVLVMPNTPP